MSALLEFKARLDELENLLKEQDLLPNKPPGESALASTQPFAIDTMPFTSWLAFVFIRKCRAMLVEGRLPPSMAIGPAAEVYLPKNATPVIEQLYLLDAITQSNSDK